MLEFKLMAYGFGHVINDIVTHLYFSYLMIYITGPVVNLSELEGAIVLLCGQTVDALATPVLGVFCDYFSADHPIRNRKRFHFGGVLLYVSSSALLWAVCLSCDTDPSLNLFYIIFVVSGVNIGYSATEIAFLSLVPFLHGSEQVRTQLVSFAQLNNVVSGIIAYISFIVVTQEYGLYDSFGRLFGLYICIAAPVTFVFYRCLTSTPYVDIVGEATNQLPEPSSIRDWFKTVEFYSVGTAYVTAKMVLNITQVFLPLFTKEQYGEESPVLGVIPLLQFSSSFAATLAAPYLNRCMDKERSYAFGCSITLLACIIFAATGNDNPDIIYFVACLIGFGTMLCLVIATTMISDLCESKAESASFVYGFFGLVAKIGAGLLMVYAFAVDEISLLSVLTTVPSVALILAVLARMILERPELWVHKEENRCRALGCILDCSCSLQLLPNENIDLKKPTRMASIKEDEPGSMSAETITVSANPTS